MHDHRTRSRDRHDAVCVIGAGGSGLAAIKNLREHGFAVDCYERETGVGGAWNWRHDRSPVYASTHLISSRPLTQFPDFPMPDTWPDYPHHSQVLAYLERYAEHFGLREHIWFGTEVVAVSRPSGGRWDVTTRRPRRRRGPDPALRRRGGGQRAQLVAEDARVRGPGGLPGRDDPRSAYKDPAQLRGRRVLVIGGGNTGCDIAVEAAQQAAAVLALHPARLLVRARSTCSAAPPTRSTSCVLAVAAAAAAAPVALQPHAAAHRRRPDPVRAARAGPPAVRDPPDRQQPARLLPRPRRDHPGAGRGPVRRRRGGARRRPARRARTW